MNATIFLIDILFNLYLMVVILRIWLQLAKADFYNPFSQFVVKATHPIVAPMRRIIPSFGRLDTASIVLAFIVAAAKVFLLQTMSGQGEISAVGLLIAAIFTVFKEVFSLLFWILILRAILSWVSQGQNPIEYVMYQLTEPMLSPIRKIIPPLGGLDLSILIALIGLQFFQILFQDFLRYVF